VITNHFWTNVLFSPLLLADHHFEGKHFYFDNFFTSLSLLEKLKLQRINAMGTIRSDRVGIPTQFALKEKMERVDHKSIVISNTNLCLESLGTKCLLIFRSLNNCAWEPKAVRKIQNFLLFPNMGSKFLYWLLFESNEGIIERSMKVVWTKMLFVRTHYSDANEKLKLLLIYQLVEQNVFYKMHYWTFFFVFHEGT
jgi:hypothetical protein